MAKITSEALRSVMSKMAEKKKTNHTPGPWVVSSAAGKGKNLRPYAIYAQSDCICDVLSEIEEGPTQRDTANARLIAAAPDMLDALQALSAMYVNTWDKTDGGLMMMGDGVAKFEKAHAKAEAAIAKALL